MLKFLFVLKKEKALDYIIVYF